jgi:hypothetical protein
VSAGREQETKLRFEYLRRDVGKLEDTVSKLVITVDSLKGRQWPNFITMLLICIPLYALVVDLIIQRAGK